MSRISELDDAKREAESLAMSLWKRYYREASPDFELCDSVAGVITQIDNMAAGLLERIDELECTGDKISLAQCQERSRNKDAEITRLNAVLDEWQAGKRTLADYWDEQNSRNKGESDECKHIATPDNTAQGHCCALCGIDMPRRR